MNKELYSYLLQDAKPERYKTPGYDDSNLKKAVDDIDKRIDQKMALNSRKQAIINAILIVIGVLTLIATVAGVVLQVVR